jgi:phosphate transport system permease protein
MSGGRYLRRRVTSKVMMGLFVLCLALALVPLVSVLAYILLKGLPALNLAFFTQLPKPVGEPGGGMGNAIAGTLTLLALASVIAIPTGIMAGIYLAEFGRGRLASLMRFLSDVLTGIPSITLGIFVYGLIVLPMQRFSAIAGGVALSIVMIPTITRTTEDMLRLVPRSLREGAWALGIPKWRTILKIVIPSASGGIITGIMLAAARAAGETAPLLFTSLGNRFWQSGLDQPIAALPLQIFSYAISPYEEWHAQAWAGALVLTLMILIISIVVRVYSSGRHASVR